MGLGDDIKEIYQDVGSEIYILRDNETYSGEYIDSELNAQVTKPFIREHHREASFQYDTRAIAGDVIQVVPTSEKFLVVNLDDELLEGETIEKAGVLYKCNVSGELLRPSGEVRGEYSYHIQSGWETLRNTAYGLLVQSLYGSDILQNEDIGQIEVSGLELFLPENYGAQPLDRYMAISGEYFKIETVKKWRHPGVVVCEVVEDTR